MDSTTQRKAPWPDFAGNDLYEGDIIIHPNGEQGVIRYVPTINKTVTDDWLVEYRGSSVGFSRLVLQVGSKGQAVRKASTYPDKIIGSEEHLHNVRRTLERGLQYAAKHRCTDGKYVDIFTHALDELKHFGLNFPEGSDYDHI
jgi:hypothetical protein